MLRRIYTLILLLAPLCASAQQVAPVMPFAGMTIGAHAGRFVGAPVTGATSSQAVSAANRLWMSPFGLANTITVKSLSFDIGTGNAAAWNARMCIYTDDGSGGIGLPGKPSALVADSGTVAIGSGSVTGIQTATLGSGGTSLGAGFYWVGMMADSASESLFAPNNAGAYYASNALVGFGTASTLYTNAPTQGWYMAQTFGACPASFSNSPTDSAGQVVPYIALGF